MMKIYKTLYILILSFAPFLLSAQENEVDENLEGKDFSKLKFAWTAQWITHPTESTLDFGSFYFRRNFELGKVQDEFPIHISADNKYWLYVNGKYIGCGPETGDIDNYRYETRDIAPYLKSGKNVIAIEVINYGEYRKASQQTFQTALICQFDNSLDKKELNTGRPGWKVKRNMSRNQIPFVSDSLNGYYAAGPGDIFRAEAYEPDWNKLGYNDSSWETPKPATIEFAAGRGFLYGSIWFLVPRTLPYHSDTIEEFKKVYENGKEKDYLKKKDLLTVKPGNARTLLFDNGVHTIGMPEIIFSGGKGSKIKITYSEALYDENGKKGNRNEIKGKKIMGYYDLVFPDGRDSMSFKPTAMKAYRFVQLDIEPGTEPLVIHHFTGRRTAYPFEVTGDFKSSDSELNTIYETAGRTLLDSSFEDFIDPYYEQLQYIGDTRIEALVALSMSSDLRLMRKAILTFNNSRIPEGLTQSRYPSYITQVIPPYSLIWIHMIHDYLTYGGDPEILTEVLPGCETVLNWFERHLDSNSMLHDMRWWNFTDWASGYPNGIPPGADNGHSATLTLQYIYALQKMEEIYQEIGNTERAEELREIEKRSCSAIKRLCYNKTRGLFKEAIENDIYSQHTQVLAVLTGLVPENQERDFLRKISEDHSLIQMTIYFKFYFFEALKKAGAEDLYLDNLDNWYNMVRDGLTTFAETDINPRSECHGWSASPAYHFKTIIAGINSDGFGFRKVHITPSLGEIKELDVAMPHPAGTIKTHYKQSDEKLSVAIILPEGLDGDFEFEGQKIRLHSGMNKFELNK